MGRKKGGGGGKASALLKTMGRGSPRTRAPEEDAASPAAEPETTATRAADGDGGTADGPVGTRASARRSSTTGRSRTGAQPARAKRRERPAKPVRITVDLDAERHRFLRDFAHQEDARGTEIVRALLDELGSDEDLVERVRDRLAAGE